MRKLPWILMLFLLIVGCGTRNVMVVDPVGRPMPNPHYILEAIGTPISVMFYYQESERIKDKDGTIIEKPSFHPIFETNTIPWSEDHSLYAVLEIYNPKQIEYSVMETRSIKTKGGGDIRTYKEVATSTATFRSLKIPLPYWKGLKDVNHRLELKAEKDTVLTMGDFNYILKEGGENVNSNR